MAANVNGFKEELDKFKEKIVISLYNRLPVLLFV